MFEQINLQRVIFHIHCIILYCFVDSTDARHLSEKFGIRNIQTWYRKKISLLWSFTERCSNILMAQSFCFVCTRSDNCQCMVRPLGLNGGSVS